MLSKCGSNCVVKREKQVEPPVPVYEEVTVAKLNQNKFHLEENIAYGPLQYVASGSHVV